MIDDHLVKEPGKVPMAWQDVFFFYGFSSPLSCPKEDLNSPQGRILCKGCLNIDEWKVI